MGAIGPSYRQSGGRGLRRQGQHFQQKGRSRMCLAIPGQVVEVVDEEHRLATVDVAGVRRNVNIGLLDFDGVGVGPGDWVLIHVGFAISQVDEEEARATRSLLERMGADYEQELEQLKASVIE
jgi:hydrogenase expression/formation protein HypC